MAVTFFGNRDAPLFLKTLLENIVCSLVYEGERDFFIGDSGSFDKMALSAVESIKAQCPWINLTVVLSTHPTIPCKQAASLLPCEILSAPPKFRIDRRNRWLIDHSDIIVTFAPFSFGGAYKFKTLALKKGKRIIELSEFAP